MTLTCTNDLLYKKKKKPQGLLLKTLKSDKYFQKSNKVQNQYQKSQIFYIPMPGKK